MSEELKNCPFCGVSMHIESTPHWLLLVGDHDEKCVFIDALHPSRVGEQGYLVEGDELMTVALHQRIVAARASKAAARVEDEREAFEAYILSRYPGATLGRHRPGHLHRAGRYIQATIEAAWSAWSARAALSAPPASVPAELTNVRCMCGDEYPHDSYGAGFIAGSGMCENCRAIRGADRKAMDELKAMSFDELLKLSEGKAPPAAGVPDAWIAKCNGSFILDLCLPDADDERATLDWQPLYKHPFKQPDSDSVPLYEAIEDACALLPYGWLIEVCAEREAGWVTLHDSNGEKVNFPTNNERLDYTVNDAVEFAILATHQSEESAL